MNVPPNNMEKYMAFVLVKASSVLDSFQFMSSSIDKLASNLSDEAYRYTSKVLKNEQFKLMSKKGVYTYDYMSSFDKFNNKQLVKKDEFYSILSDEHISDNQ